MQHRTMAALSALYFAMPRWVIVIAAIALIPLLPLLSFYWMVIAIVAFGHQIIMVILFASVIFVNFSHVVSQLRGICGILLGIPGIIRQVVMFLPSRWRAAISKPKRT